MEDCKAVIEENDQLREEVQVKNRELLRISIEKENHPGEFGSQSQGQPDKNEDGSSPAGVNQVIIELKNKAHLLSEENQILFQQITVLRSHYDQFNKDN